jgi:glycosyltransferase involved in cell wall biosynthesis
MIADERAAIGGALRCLHLTTRCSRIIIPNLLMASARDRSWGRSMSDLTVLLCTRNGEPTLAAVLDGYVKQQLSGFTWEMVIVDNGSTDGTAALIRRYQSRLPLTLIYHPVLGKNRAVNRGLADIKAAFIVMTDDDAVPAPDFLQAWWEIAQRAPDYDLFGGRIEPDFPSPPPDWLKRAYRLCAILFARCDLPEGPMAATQICGPNMAVRRRVLDAGIAFNETIGPNGADPDYPMGSETDFCYRAARAGHRAYFARDPLVRHIVRPHQMEPGYWRSRVHRNGRGAARIVLTERATRFSIRTWALWAVLAVSQAALWLYSALCPYQAGRRRARLLLHWIPGFRQELLVHIRR